MGDIFDQVSPDSKGDIFDQVSPNVGGNVEAPNFLAQARQALASGPSAIGPSVNYYGNEAPSGAIRSGILGQGFQKGWNNPSQAPSVQMDQIDVANKAMDMAGVNRIPNQNMIPDWMSKFRPPFLPTQQAFQQAQTLTNPQQAVRFAGAMPASVAGAAVDMASRPLDTVAMMAMGIPTGEGLVGAGRSMPAMQGYGEMFNISPELKAMNVGDRIMQAMPFLNRSFGGQGNNVEQMVQNSNQAQKFGNEAYKTTSEVIPMNERYGGAEQKRTGQQFPSQTRYAAEEVVPSKDYSGLLQQMQTKNKVLWRNIVQRLTGKSNLNKAQFVNDVKQSLAEFMFREKGRAGYSDSERRTIADIVERFMAGMQEQEAKTGKYDMLDALMDKRTENEITARLRRMEQLGQGMEGVSGEKIAHEAIREALLKQVTQADPEAGEMARKWGQIDEATNKISQLSQRESNTVQGGINPVEATINPKGSAIKAISDRVMGQDLGSKTAKIAENIKKMKQLQAETDALMKSSFHSSPAYSGSNGPFDQGLEKMPPFTNRPSPEGPNWTRPTEPPPQRGLVPNGPRGLQGQTNRPMPEGQGQLPAPNAPKQLEKQFESRPAPRQLEYQNSNRLVGDEKRSAIIKSRQAKMNRKKAGDTLIGQRTLENEAELKASRNQKKSLGAADASEFSNEDSPAVMAPPRNAEGVGASSTTTSNFEQPSNVIISKLDEIAHGNPHLQSQVDEIKSMMSSGDPEASSVAREFIQSDPMLVNKGVAEAPERNPQGIGARSSEAPLSESKTIREGNPDVTDVGEKSVGAMQLKNSPKGIVVDKNFPPDSKTEDGKFVAKFSVMPNGDVYLTSPEKLHVHGLPEAKNGKHAGVDFDHILRVIQSEDGKVVYVRASTNPKIEKMLAESNPKAWDEMANMQRERMKKLMDGRPNTKVILASGRDFGGLDSQREITEALWDKVDPKYKMTTVDTKWGHLGKHVRPDEGGAQSPQMVRNVNNSLEYVLSPKEVETIARAGQAKRGWDSRWNQADKTIWGEKEGPIFSDFVAATSQGAPIQENYRMATQLFKNWREAGMPTDTEGMDKVIRSVKGIVNAETGKTYDGRYKNLVRAMRREPLQGPKISEWAKAGQGDPEALTNDRHIIRNMSRQPINEEGTDANDALHLAIKIRFRQVAEKTGWAPREVQESFWSYVKGLSDSGLIQKEGLKHGEETYAALMRTPEYATTFEDPKIRQYLKEAGVPDFRINKAISDAKAGLEESAALAKKENLDEDFLNKTLQKLQEQPMFKKKLAGIKMPEFEEGNEVQFTKRRRETEKSMFHTDYSAADYRKMGARTFLANDGKVGYALSKDGEIMSVFNNSDTKGLGAKAVEHALSQGGTKLDCIGNTLRDFYRQFGFEVYDEIAFDPKHAPKGWTEEMGRPPIYKMRTIRAKLKKGEI